MTGLEVVGLWSSIVVGLIGGTLAVVAIIFTRSADTQNNALNQRFTEVLTSINEKSENTERQINTMVSRVVETFLDVRASGIPQAAEVQEPEQDKDAVGEDVSSEVRRFMARMAQSIEEISLRQRAQPSAPSEFSGFAPGDRVLIKRGPHEGSEGSIRGRTTVLGRTTYAVRLDSSDSVLGFNEDTLEFV